MERWRGSQRSCDDREVRRICRPRLSELLDLNQTNKIMLLVSLLLPTFALRPHFRTHAPQHLLDLILFRDITYPRSEPRNTWGPPVLSIKLPGTSKIETGLRGLQRRALA